MRKIAVLGNPNTGKSSVFNLLTGLRQKTGNFAGVTVDVKTGQITTDLDTYKLIDFPGTYSIFPRGNEEKVVFNILSNPDHPSFPEILVVVLDASNLERNLLLFDQLYSLNLPIMMVLTMRDKVRSDQQILPLNDLQLEYPRAKIVEVNGRIGLGKERILAAIDQLAQENLGDYSFSFSSDPESQKLDVENRKSRIKSWFPSFAQATQKNKTTHKADQFLLHPIFGYFFFLIILFLLFQSVFSLAKLPMDWIDLGFSWLSASISESLPSGIFNDLLTEGILPGISGVLVFVPQIALLFLFIGILEETGYLSRVIFLMDRLMRPLGLNGRSVVPLISSWACAVPGIMAARMITNWKERMITILVAPLMSCSARIPVYTILIALIIPDQTVLGFFNLQGLVLLGLYLLGLVSALGIAFVLNRLIKRSERSFLLLELPSYHFPHWKNVGTVVYDKTKTFVVDAGKIILALSIVLWFGSSFGPKGHVSEMTPAELSAEGVVTSENIGSLRIENSFIGLFGKTIEPVIRPLGYDWKIGIALISSFAAREVFVGTLASIYSVEDADDNTNTLIERMKNQRWPSGEVVYSFATGISLLVFYAYALQCMATVAVVKKETNSWAWAIGQLIALGSFAYLVSFLVYQWLK